MSVREDAENTVIYLAVGGVLAIVVGSVVAGVQWPSDRYDDHGNALVAYLGLGVAVLGQLALFVALVAVGTRLGVRWSGLLDPEAPDPPARPSYLDEDGL